MLLSRGRQAAQAQERNGPLTGENDLSRLSVLEESSWETEERGFVGSLGWWCLFKRRERKEGKGEKKQ